jgi:hypothetical protein
VTVPVSRPTSARPPLAPNQPIVSRHPAHQRLAERDGGSAGLHRSFGSPGLATDHAITQADDASPTPAVSGDGDG